MQLLILIVSCYIVLVHTRDHISLPGRFGMVLGGVGGYWAGAWAQSMGINFPLLPLIYAAMLGLFVGARFHRLFKDTFKE